MHPLLKKILDPPPKLLPIFRIQTFLNYILASPLLKLKISRVVWLASLIFGLLVVGLSRGWQELKKNKEAKTRV